jgi:hypothetical protein
MIDSESISVQAYYINEEKKWILKEHKDISDTLTFVSMGFDMALSDIYYYVHF